MLTGDHSLMGLEESHANRSGSDAQRCMRAAPHTRTKAHVCTSHTHIKIKLFTLKRGRERMFALNTKRSINLEEKKTNGLSIMP